jgi:sec-independent protein translocase protein TatB
MVISPPIQVATIGMGDSILLMVIALVVLGPRRLPQVGRQIGKLMYEFRKASNDFKFQMEEELRNAEEADRRKREEAERQRTLAEAQQAVAQAQSAAAQALDSAAQAQSAVAEISHTQAAQTAVEHSQVPESGPEAPAPAVNAAAPIAAGNIYDSTYAEPAAESGLRVQPPSTGEPVQAARPGRATTEFNAADGSDAGASEASLKKDVAAEEAHAATESTTHHG